MLGFQEVLLPVNDVIYANGQSAMEPFLVLEGGEECELRSMQLLCEII